ncbi:lasso peptide biosynthesis B2 protein [Nostoc sp. CCY 9925]|uniref:lasso peptide biosynthesis B2 protein n=1 Tax=Nostoc sp. CCY 9925 TaxID=3103865 RepID=UPI0039C62022
MKQLHKFLSRNARERLLLVKAALLLVYIGLGLRLLLFQHLRKLLAKIAQLSTKLLPPDDTYVNEVAWAVTVASRYIPGAKCLTQALTTQVLLAWHGYPTQLCIGFTIDKGGQMSAHAWVESQGQIVIGGAENMTRYIQVPLQEVESDKIGSWNLETIYKVNL